MLSLNSTTRRKKAKLRKNFLPTLIFTVFLWILLTSLIYFVDPSVLGATTLFFVLLFFALLFTLSTTFANARRGFLTTLGLTVFLILRFFGIGNVLNFLLIAGVVITIELYFWKSS